MYFFLQKQINTNYKHSKRLNMRKFFTLSLILFSLNSFAQDYFPMVVGNTWILNYLDSNGSVTGTDSTVITSNYKLDNLNIFLLNHITDSYIDSLYTDNDNHNDIYIRMGGEWSKVWQHQYKVGEGWPFFIDSVHVEYKGKVTVPAGSFDSCYFVTFMPQTGWVFAPNVGIVQAITNGTVSSELIRYRVVLEKSAGLNEVLNSNISVYPNPSSDYISIPDIENSLYLDICDITGKTYFSQNNQSQSKQRINISSYPTGIYFGKMIMNDNRIATFKFSKK